MTADIDLKQGTEEWRRACAGSLGAASVHKALLRLKSGGWSAERANVMNRLIAERLTGIPGDRYVTPAMQWGIDKEPEARAKYAAERAKYAPYAAVTEVGIVRHPRIAGAHASPDGFVGDIGLVEFKCPTTSTHLETLQNKVVPPEYLTQMQWQLACSTGRQWCDYVSYDPRLAPALQMIVIPNPRDDLKIEILEAGVLAFLGEMQAKLDELARTFGDISAPPYVDPMTTGFEPVIA